jgi:hypothetical protein
MEVETMIFAATLFRKARISAPLRHGWARRNGSSTEVSPLIKEAAMKAADDLLSSLATSREGSYGDSLLDPARVLRL